MKEFDTAELSEAEQQLQGLLTYANPNREEIDGVIERVEVTPAYNAQLDTPYSKGLDGFVEGQVEVVSPINGEVLIDLGGGRNPIYTSRIAKMAQAGLFIDVEKSLPGKVDPRKDVSGELDFIKDNLPPTAFVKDDMLDFVSRLKSDSSNFTINGIDTDIIEPEEYHRLLASEILRATKAGGLVFGASSLALQYLAEMPDMKIVLADSRFPSRVYPQFAFLKKVAK